MPRCFEFVSSRRGTLCCALFLLLSAITSSTRADLSLAVQKILVEPTKFELRGGRSRQQLVVTGVYGENDFRDVTHLVEITSSNPGVVRVDQT
ncbi:MAG: hypothetical protein KDA84_17005, partial [Planctomycetaceae bacterium]|nr:hypothetical protein [Planctomycetaceae bacterium]